MNYNGYRFYIRGSYIGSVKSHKQVTDRWIDEFGAIQTGQTVDEFEIIRPNALIIKYQVGNFTITEHEIHIS